MELTVKPIATKRNAVRAENSSESASEFSTKANAAPNSLLILNGSPRTAGTVAKILREIEQGAKDSGCETVFIDVASLSFASCTGCMACRTKRACVLPHDDAHVIAERIGQCAALAVGTPVYWGNMNGNLKRLFDRLVYALETESPLGIPRPHHKGKRAAIVTACTTPFPFNIVCGQTTKAAAALKEILSWSGFRVQSHIAMSGTKQADKATPRQKRRARKCAKRLALATQPHHK